MIRHLIPLAFLMSAAPALADSDELAPVPANAVIGRTYPGDGAPSVVRFINVRSAPVSLVWIGVDGKEHLYGTIETGQEWVQPTFVTHRWLVKDSRDGTPIEAFISTRSAVRDEGTAQIALILRHEDREGLHGHHHVGA